MSKDNLDEEKREKHLERQRIQREASANKRRQTRNAHRRRPQTMSYKNPQESTQQIPEKDQNKSHPGDDFPSKKASIKSELTSLTFRTRNLPEKVNQLDNSIREISTRIQNIRENHYQSQSNLEETYSNLQKTWDNISPNIHSYSLEQSNQLLNRQSDLEARIDRADSLGKLSVYRNMLSTLNSEYINIENALRSQIDNFQSQYQVIDSNLRTAEETVSNLVNSSIEWKNHEHPVLAVKVNDLTHDKKGIMTLTNLRIIFEEVREEVIRKKLFIATEKKTIHEVILDQPIGSIEQIEKGRVGFLKGAGLFISFKPQTRLDEIKIDTDGNEDEKILHFYNYVISGKANEELESVKETVEDHIPLNCPTCSAPYREEILIGQTSVKCIYCGNVIKV